MLSPIPFIVIAFLAMVVSCVAFLRGFRISRSESIASIFIIIIIDALLGFALWWGFSRLWWITDTPAFWLFVLFIVPGLLLFYCVISLFATVLDYLKV